MKDKHIYSDNETIDFNKLDLNTNIPKLQKRTQQEQLLDEYIEEYLLTLKENYDAQDNLFEIISELLDESEDKEKSIQILNSL